MATAKQIAASTLYANILEEIRIRLEAIDTGTSGKLGFLLPPPIVREFCFLQLRLICELIALGCLVAHGDIAKSKKLQKEWDATKIMSALEQLHADFFPRAHKRTLHADRRGHHIEPLNDRLTKHELLKLYGECGNVLHRGNVKKLMKDHTQVQINFPEITTKAQKINDLLAEHLIAMLGGKMFFFAILRSASEGGRPQVAIAEAPILLDRQES